MNLKKLQEKPHKHIGIVAVSAPGAALYYQTIIAENNESSPLPTVDTTRLLARSAVDFSL